MLVILSQHYGLQGYGLPGSSPLSFVFAMVASLLFVVFVFRRQAKKFKKQIVELNEQNLKEAATVKNSPDVITLTGSGNSLMDHWEKGFTSGR